MSDPIITNNNIVGVAMGFDNLSDDHILTATGAITLEPGTVLGRITTGGKLIQYVSGAADGSQIPFAILAVQHVFTGAGDQAIRPIISGRVRQSKLIAFGVGAISAVEKTLLRNVDILAIDTQELSILDNQ